MHPPPVIMMMGPPGSGKGTQAQALRARYGFELVETGSVLRRLGAESSPGGQRLKAILDAGRLAPPPLAARLVIDAAERILKLGQGVVFDGSPRTLHEAELLLAALRRQRVARVLVVFLEVPEQETVNRIVNRWTCVGCERFAPGAAQTPAACAACGGKLVRRADDTAAVARTRWEEYAFRTLPVIRLLERQGLVIRVDGNRPSPEVSAETRARVAEFFKLSG